MSSLPHALEPRCTSELWPGVRCTLHAGHVGSHQRPATDTQCALSWRSRTATPPPVPQARVDRTRVEFFQLLRNSRRSEWL